MSDTVRDHYDRAASLPSSSDSRAVFQVHTEHKRAWLTWLCREVGLVDEREDAAPRQPVAVWDLGAGRGGDLWAWVDACGEAPVDLWHVDVSRASCDEAYDRRWPTVRRHRRRTRLHIHVVCDDAFAASCLQSLRRDVDRLRLTVKAVWSAFALHYCRDVRQFMRDLAACVGRGVLFVCIVHDLERTPSRYLPPGQAVAAPTSETSLDVWHRDVLPTRIDDVQRLDVHVRLRVKGRAHVDAPESAIHVSDWVSATEDDRQWTCVMKQPWYHNAQEDADTYPSLCAHDTDVASLQRLACHFRAVCDSPAPMSSTPWPDLSRMYSVVVWKRGA